MTALQRGSLFEKVFLVAAAFGSIGASEPTTTLHCEARAASTGARILDVTVHAAFRDRRETLARSDSTGIVSIPEVPTDQTERFENTRVPVATEVTVCADGFRPLWALAWLDDDGPGIRFEALSPNPVEGLISRTADAPAVHQPSCIFEMEPQPDQTGTPSECCPPGLTALVAAGKMAAESTRFCRTAGTLPRGGHATHDPK